MVNADVPGAESTFLALKWKMLSGFTGSSLWFQTHGPKRSQVPGAIMTVDLEFSDCLNVLFPLSVTMDWAGVHPRSAEFSFSCRETLFLSSFFWWNNSGADRNPCRSTLHPEAICSCCIYSRFLSWPASWTRRDQDQHRREASPSHGTSSWLSVWDGKQAETFGWWMFPLGITSSFPWTLFSDLSGHPLLSFPEHVCNVWMSGTQTKR